LVQIGRYFFVLISSWDEIFTMEISGGGVDSKWVKTPPIPFRQFFIHELLRKGYDIREVNLSVSNKLTSRTVKLDADLFLGRELVDISFLAVIIITAT